MLEQLKDDVERAAGRVKRLLLVTGLDYRALTVAGVTRAKVQEYIEEAEHLEGESYWFSFKNSTELQEDIIRYVNA